MHAKSILRWLLIAGFGGLGIYVFIDGIVRVSRQANAEGAAFWFWLVALSVLLIISGLLVSMAYLVFRRHYARLWKLILVVTALIAYGFFGSLPKRFGYIEREIDFPWSVVIGLLLTVAAFSGAYWVYRRGQALISRFVNANERVDQRRQD